VEPPVPPVEVPEAPPVPAPEAPPVEVPEAPPVPVPELPPVEVPEAPPVPVPELPPVEVPEAPPVPVPELPPVEVPALASRGAPPAASGVLVGEAASPPQAANVGVKHAIVSRQPRALRKWWDQKLMTERAD
jgi:hypothetical protein